jgi:hypothetical protein
MYWFYRYVGNEYVKRSFISFWLNEKKFESSNETSKLSNEQMLMALDAKASEAKGEFALADGTTK